jgi:hypothetical protein
MANAQPQILVQLELNEAEQRLLLSMLTSVVNGMERSGYAQKQPERFRVATCLLLQLQNKAAACSVHQREVAAGG